MNRLTLNPSDFKVLELVSLEPRSAFSKAHDYFLDTFKLSPVDDLEVSGAVAEKLKNSGFWYLSELLELCEPEITRRANLEDKEVVQIRAALTLRKLAFHPSSTLTKQEQINTAKFRFEGEIKYLHEALALGYPEAGVFLGRLAELGVVDGEVENYYSKAVSLGSGQAANDLGVILQNKKNHCRELIIEIIKLYSFGIAHNIHIANENIKVAEKTLEILDKEFSDKTST